MPISKKPTAAKAASKVVKKTITAAKKLAVVKSDAPTKAPKLEVQLYAVFYENGRAIGGPGILAQYLPVNGRIPIGPPKRTAVSLIGSIKTPDGKTSIKVAVGTALT